MPILVNREGHMFLDFKAVNEEDIMNIATDAPLTHSLVVAKYQGNFLMMFDKWKQHWELPGGVIENGESPRECAVRELYEETYQKVENLSFKGLMKFQLKPDDRVEYGALFSGEIKEPSQFKENNDAEKIEFWDKVRDIGFIDEIDVKLLEYY